MDVICQILLCVILCYGSVKVIHKGDAPGGTGIPFHNGINGKSILIAVALDIAADISAVILQTVRIGRSQNDDAVVGESTLN